MIYLFHGDESAAALAGYKLAQGLLGKRPFAQLFRLDPDSYNPQALEEVLQSQTLFAPNHILLARGVLKVEEARGQTLGFLKEMEVSPHVFIFVEGEVTAALKKQFEKHAKKITEYDGATKKPEYNLFPLLGAIGERDRKGAWILFIEAVLRGQSAEEMFWRIMWQVKAMQKAALAASPNEAGQKPFVYEKARRGASVYGEALSKLSWSLISLYHDSRLGKRDMEAGLERILLSL